MVCAFLPGLLTALSVSWVASHAFEWGFTIAAMLFGLVAAIVGWRSHRSRPAVLLLLAGVLGLLFARLLEEGVGHSVGATAGLLAGGILIAGHLQSLRASCKCAVPCAKSESRV